MFAAMRAWLDKGNLEGRARRRIYTGIIVWLGCVATAAAWRAIQDRPYDIYVFTVDAIWYFALVYVGGKFTEKAIDIYSVARGRAPAERQAPPPPPPQPPPAPPRTP